MVLFQPHRYSRTQALFKEFLTAFHEADYLVMTDIYAASEEPVEGVDGRSLLAAIEQHGQRHTEYLAGVDTLARDVLGIVRENDLVLTLGAGNIYRAGEELIELLAAGKRP